MKILVSLLLLLLFAFTMATMAKDSAENIIINKQLEQLKILRDKVMNDLDIYAEKEGIKSESFQELCNLWRTKFYEILKEHGFYIDSKGWIQVEKDVYMKYDSSCRVHKRVVKAQAPVDDKKAEMAERTISTEAPPPRQKQSYRVSGYGFIALILILVMSVFFLKGIVDSLLARRGMEALFRFLLFMFVVGTAVMLMGLL